MEARKRAANKRRKMQKLGKSRSTETEEEDEEPDEGGIQIRFRDPVRFHIFENSDLSPQRFSGEGGLCYKKYKSAFQRRSSLIRERSLVMKTS